MWAAIVAIGVSFAALGVSILSWRAIVQTNRASVFEHRMQVYQDVETFIRRWRQLGTPDMAILADLTNAHQRSKFLFPAEVTEEIRTLWTDAVQADFDAMVINGDTPGDRDEAIERRQALTLKHTEDGSRMQTLFEKQLKVRT
ncbi:hypothetical protein [Nitratireductor sp. XY-223]|uniref:hypothetical protein n=1 Tax=Nitratireductor sp. XY-223 TaxID=2561926 RepID=UPI0010AAFBAD|nr:hypothetical protein [Nitratireductor sp. XY-223]